MKILFVSAVFPYPLYSGGQVRIYNLLREAAKKHDITLFSFIRSERENDYISELPFCRRVETVHRGRAWQAGYVLGSVFGKYPLLLSTYHNAVMRERLDAELKSGDYDLVHLEPFYVWPSVPHTSLPIVVAEHNIEYDIYDSYVRQFSIPFLRPLLAIDVLKLRFWEAYVWGRGSHIISVSEEDRKVIGNAVSGDKVSIVPNGVDTSFFRFQPKRVPGTSPFFLFVGNFSWLQNRDALRFLLQDIWPYLKKRFPEHALRVVGMHLPADLRNLCTGERIELHETVGDIRTEYYAADALLAPIRIGGGTKYKILEAMASGTPVVGTSKGASGLSLTPGREILLAESPPEFADQLERIGINDTQRKDLRLAARRRIEADFSWTKIARSLDAVWKRVYAQSH